MKSREKRCLSPLFPLCGYVRRKRCLLASFIFLIGIVVVWDRSNNRQASAHSLDGFLSIQSDGCIVWNLFLLVFLGPLGA